MMTQSKLRLGVDIQKPFDAATAEAARKSLQAEWTKRGGGKFAEVITEKGDLYAIDWISR